LFYEKTITVISALIKQVSELPVELYKTLLWDRGAEMTNNTRSNVATDIQVYVCDPQPLWQPGSNENTNRLLRPHLPKGTDLSIHSQQSVLTNLLHPSVELTAQSGHQNYLYQRGNVYV
jgi:IS30 family transposase